MTVMEHTRHRLNKAPLSRGRDWLVPIWPSSFGRVFQPRRGQHITNCMTHILNTNNTILTGDFNAHHTLWHSPTTDNRGTLIADLINSSNQIVLNTNTPTRIPTNCNHQATSPDISTASNTIYSNITWSTLNALNSDHNPIKISYNTKTKFWLIQQTQLHQLQKSRLARIYQQHRKRTDRHHWRNRRTQIKQNTNTTLTWRWQTLHPKRQNKT